MKARAATLPAVPFSCGVLIAVLAFYGRSPFEYTILALTIAAGCLAIYYGVRRSAAYFITGLGCGILSCAVNRVQSIPETYFHSDKTDYSFELLRVSEGARGIRCLGKALPPELPFIAVINITDRGQTFQPGDYIRLKAHADDLFHFSEVPYMESDILSARCDGATAKFLTASENVHITGHSDALRYRLLGMRDRLSMAIYTSDLPPEVSSLIASVCLGTDDTPASTRERFRAAGTAHLLCVSGFHVAIVAWFAVLLLWPLRLWSRRGRLRYLLIIALVWAYVAIIGFTPSAIRAAIMLSVFYIARLLQRGSSSYNSLALAFGLLLLVQPRWLYSVGLQLSVGAVLGILIFAGRLNPASMRYPAAHRIFEVFTVPVAALLGTAPVLLCRFHSLPMLTVITNAFVSLLFLPFIVLGIAAVTFSCFGVPIGALSAVLTFLYNIIVRICEYSDSATAISNIYLSELSLCLLLACIVFAAILIHMTGKRTRLAAGCAVAVLAILSACSREDAPQNEMLVAGNSRASELILRLGDKGYTLDISRSLNSFAYLKDYFGGHGIDADSIIKNPIAESINADIAIATHPKRFRILRPARNLIVDGSYRGDISETISAVNPIRVILCANVPAEKAAAWEQQCREKEIEVKKVGNKALRVTL